MINYNILNKTNTFYIIFEDNINKILVEKLINYWYKIWFTKSSYCSFEWLTNNKLKIFINLLCCVNNDYNETNFLMCLNHNITNNKTGLYQILKYGVSTITTEIDKLINPFFIITDFSLLLIKNDNMTEIILNEVDIVFNEYRNGNYKKDRLFHIIDLYEKSKLLYTNNEQITNEYNNYFSYYSTDI